MKLNSFYAVLALFVLLWIALFKPYEVQKHRSVDSTLTLASFLYQELDENRTRLELKGESGRYVGKRFIVRKLLLVDKQKEESVEANEGVYEDGIVRLKGDVHFQSQEYTALGEEAIYETKEKILRIPSKFWLFAKDLNLTGYDLVYYKSSGTIEAYNIEAKVWVR